MAMGTVPTVFVSSTCYDLKQIRSDLYDFIESLGLQPIISEHRSFPIDPGITAIENCLKVVDERADILVLIVGGKYGAPTPHGKSVTNLEYLRARAKGIPIYVFIENSILSILPVWKANPKGDYRSVVDSVRLFEFVERLRDTENVWVVGFEYAQDIRHALKEQLAYLFMDSLAVLQRIKAKPLPESLIKLSGVPLRLVVEQPPFWEYRLFANLLVEEIDRFKQQRWDLDYGIVFGQGEHLREPQEVIKWIDRKLAEQVRFITVTENIINQALQDAFGAPGVSGDPSKIVYATQRLAAAYRAGIEWAIDTHRASVPRRFQELVDTLGTFPNNLIKEIEDYSKQCLQTIEEAIANPPAAGETREIQLTLKLTMSAADEFARACKKLAETGFFEKMSQKKVITVKRMFGCAR